MGSAKAMSMADSLFKVGVLGATGFIGSPYRSEIRDCDEAEIVAVCARRKDLLAKAGHEDGARLITENWREVVEHPDVNFVVVGTPDALHHEAVVACAAQGKHLLCEKPVGMNAAEAEEMWGLYREAQPVLAHFVPFWTRMVGVFETARDIVASGELGEIVSTVFRWQNPRPAAMPLTWRDDPGLSSAGTIADVGSHAYDVVRWIIGAEAASVLAHGETLTPSKADLGAINLEEALEWRAGETSEGGNTRKGGTVDYASLSCRYSNGAVGSYLLSHATFLRKHLAPELELHGTSASLSVDRWSGEVVMVSPDQERRIVKKAPDEGFGNRFDKWVFPSLAPIVRGEAKTGTHPDLEDGWIAQKFTDAAATSVENGCWVKV